MRALPPSACSAANRSDGFGRESAPRFMSIRPTRRPMPSRSIGSASGRSAHALRGPFRPVGGLRRPLPGRDGRRPPARRRGSPDRGSRGAPRDRAGTPARIALAEHARARPSPSPATGARSSRHLPPDQAERALRTLPVEALRCGSSVTTALRRLGLRRIGAVLGCVPRAPGPPLRRNPPRPARSDDGLPPGAAGSRSPSPRATAPDAASSIRSEARR